MKWNQVKKLTVDEFRRLTGVKQAVFNKMVSIISESLRLKKAKGGRPNQLIVEDMILMTLEYWREYRTYFHIGQSYGLGESGAYKIIRWIEDELKKQKDFHLPGKKILLKNDMSFDVVLMDATESPIERPKKNKNTFILERKKDIH